MPGNAGPLTVQWALNETVNGAIAVSKDMLAAATTDDVQVAALAAVESFGATLAICDQTETVVEDGLKRAHGSRFVQFLKSQIGYASGDSCTALSHSTGGVRFLALAAVFSTWGYFEAAQATRQMLKESQKKNQILPTLGQLQALYKVLEHKVVTFGFADQVMMWYMKLAEDLRAPDFVADPSLFDAFGNRISTRVQHSNSHPPPQTMAALVAAFRDLHRLGDASRVEIRAGSDTVWIIALIVWCIGHAPRIILKNGRVLHEDLHDESKIDLWAFMDDERVEIRTSTRLEGPEKLWKAELQADFYNWAGMVSLEMYGKKDIRDCELDRGTGNRALMQAIVHSTTEAISHISLLRDSRRGHDQPKHSNRSADLHEHLQDKLVLRKSLNLKSFHMRVAQTISRFVGESDLEKYHLRELKEGTVISQLGSVEAHARALREDCACPYCSSDPSSLEACAVDWFEYYISAITAKILAISLFELTEPVRLFLSGNRLAWDSPCPASLIAKVGRLLFPDSRFHQSLFGGILDIPSWKDTGVLELSVADLFELALSLIGHDIPPRHVLDGRWIASAQRGQVVYPHLFDSRFLHPQTVLLLDGGPGVLHHAGETYIRVTGKDQTIARLGPPQTDIHERPVDSILNLMHEAKLDWLVTPSDSSLALTCGIAGDPLIHNPFNILSTASKCRFVDSCSHSSATEMEKADLGAYYITPSWDARNHEYRERIGVIPVYGNENLRFFALICGDPGVVRLNACLKCCLDICRSDDRYKYVVC